MCVLLLSSTCVPGTYSSLHAQLYVTRILGRSLLVRHCDGIQSSFRPVLLLVHACYEKQGFHAPFPVKIRAHCFALNYKLDWKDDSRGVHLVEVYCPQTVPRHLLVRVQKLSSSRLCRSRVALEDRPIPEPKSSSVSSWCGFCADLWASPGKSNCLSARPVAVDASNL